MLDPYLFVTGLFKIAIFMMVAFGLWQLLSGRRRSLGSIVVGAVVAATFAAGWMNPELLSSWDSTYVAGN